MDIGKCPFTSLSFIDVYVHRNAADKIGLVNPMGSLRRTHLQSHLDETTATDK
jgi:hypothetical protein